MVTTSSNMDAHHAKEVKKLKTMITESETLIENCTNVSSDLIRQLQSNLEEIRKKRYHIETLAAAKEFLQLYQREESLLQNKGN